MFAIELASRPLAAISVHVNTNNPPTNIVAFRDFLRARFPEAHALAMPEVPPVQATGTPWMDALNLRKGAITEVVASVASAGTGLLLAGLLQRENACRELTALVDGSDAFDPWSIDASALERVLWVRCHHPNEAIRASDLLLRDGNIPLVILDLQMHDPRALQSLPSSVWHRLRMLAEKSGSTLCAFTPARTVACASTRVKLEQSFALMDQFEDRAVLLNTLPVQVDRQRSRVVFPSPAAAIA